MYVSQIILLYTNLHSAMTIVYLFLSCVRLFTTPWTVTGQATLSTEFSSQEYWSG